MPVEIFTDATSDLSKKRAKEHNIGIVPAAITGKNGEEHLSSELDMEAFVSEITLDNLPLTAAPSHAVNIEMYQQHPDSEVVAIHVGDTFSAYFRNARLAARELDPRGKRISVFDSGTTSMGLGYMALEAKRMAQEGMTRQQIVTWLEYAYTHVCVMAVLPDFSFALRGGRVNHLTAIIGSALRIRPILRVDGNKLRAIDKPRTWSQAIDRMIDRIPFDQVHRIAVIHGAAPERAEEIANRLRQYVEEVETVPMGPAIYIHTGKGAIGFAFICLEA
jgi:DegV family protein with EDD domain